MGGAALTDALALRCLQVSGGFRVIPTDDLLQTAGSLLLISPSEPDFWPHFTTSREYADGAPHPLDRWSRRIGSRLAHDFGAVAIYPFGGPPFQPFQTWAVRSGRTWASPIGFLVHDTGGLFISYRMALLVPWDSATPTSMRPCDACTGQPCATACPVGMGNRLPAQATFHTEHFL